MNQATIKKCGKGSKAFYLVTLLKDKAAQEIVQFNSYFQARWFAKQWRITK